MREFPSKLVRKINNKLGRLENQKDRIIDIRLNAFRTACCLLNEEYILPQNDLNGIRETDLEQYVSRLAELVPGLLQGCSLLPKTYLKGNNKYLYFVRPYTLDDRKYIYLLKVLSIYQGGAENREIVDRAVSDMSAAVRTNKIYFESLLMPVESTKLSGHSVVDFTPCSIVKYLHNYKQKIEREYGPFVPQIIGSIVFDDPDFSSIHQKLTSLFAELSDWKLQNFFWPVVYRHNSICLHLIFPFEEKIQKLLPHFDKVAAKIFKKNTIDISQENKFWQSYFTRMSWKNDYSRSGNREYVIEENIVINEN